MSSSAEYSLRRWRATTKSLHGGDRDPRFVRVEPPPGLEAYASSCGGSPRPALRPAAMSGHETPPSRHTNALPLHLLCLSPSKSRTVLGHARVLDSSTFPPLHFSTTPLFHFSTTPLFHFSTSHPHCAGKFGILCTRSPEKGGQPIFDNGRLREIDSRCLCEVPVDRLEVFFLRV